MSTWPSTLPDPQLTGYAVQAQDNTARTDMDSGPARVRRRTTSVPDEITMQVVLDETQMATFRDFFENDWYHGAAWVYVPIKDGRSAGVSLKECRPNPAKFKATPLSGALWSVELTVEVRNA